MFGTTRWDCEFTYASLALAIQYSLLLAVITTYAVRLIRDQPRQKRKPQKIFLLMGVAHAAQRVAYFALWPPLYQSVELNICSPTTGGQQKDVDSPAMNIIGSLPPCFFLSAFSINVFTFARIYHTVLAHNENMTKFRVLTFLLIFVNFVIWVLTTLELITSAEGIFKVIATTSAYAVSVTSFLVAVGFMTYGVLLFYGVRHKQREAILEHAQQNKTVVPARSVYHDHHSSDNDSSSSATPIVYPPNPMKRILLVSAVCMVCFLVRSVLLPAVLVAFDGSYNAAVIIVYLECSEIIPMVLMLKIFEGRKGQNEVPDGANASEPSHITRNGGHINNGYGRGMASFPGDGGGGNGEDMLTSLHEQLLPTGISQPPSRTTSAQPSSYGYHPYSSEWTSDDRGPQRPGPTFVARAHTSQTSNGGGGGRVSLLQQQQQQPSSRHQSAAGATVGSYGTTGNNTGSNNNNGYRTVYHSDGAPPIMNNVAPYSASPRSSYAMMSRSVGRSSGVLAAASATGHVSHASRLSNADVHIVASSLGSNTSASIYSHRTESNPNATSAPSSLLPPGVDLLPSSIVIGVPNNGHGNHDGTGAAVVHDSGSGGVSSSSSPGGRSRGGRRRTDSDTDTTRRSAPTQVVKVYTYQGEPEFRDTSDLFQLD